MVKKKQSRGRPRAYDPDAALDRAGEVFWSTGFSATSLDDLSAAMGMGRPSIYNAFGDKEDLFIKALRRYKDTIGSTPLRAMDAEDSIEAAVKAYFAQAVEYMTADRAHPGCLLSSVAAVTDNPGVRDFLQANLREMQARIAERLAQAVEEGELPPGYSATLGARLAIDGMLALATRARIGTPMDELTADASSSAVTVLRQPLL